MKLIIRYAFSFLILNSPFYSYSQSFKKSTRIDTVRFEVACFKEVVKLEKFTRPIFILRIENISQDSIEVPDYYITTVKNLSVNNILAEIKFNGVSIPLSGLSCQINPGWGINKDGLPGPDIILIGPSKSYLLETDIACYYFSKIGEYEIRFTLNKNRTGLIGRTEWIKIKVIK